MENQFNRILVIAKPDLVIRRGPGAKMLKEFLAFTESKIIASRNMIISPDMARKHYKHLSGKSFFDWIIRYITCYETFIFIIETPISAEKIRAELGSTMVEKADKRSLRGRYGLRAGMNGLHVSESETVALEEIKLWKENGILKENEIIFKVDEYISRYIDSQDNTAKIHEFMDGVGFAKDEKTKNFLHTELQKEADGVEKESFERFYNIFWEMLT